MKTLTKIEVNKDVLFNPTDALSLLQEMKNELEENRLFTFKDSERDNLYTILAALKQVELECKEIVDIISEQAGLKYSDKYKD